uniref:NADH dehydrogenase subunit 4 n=1 Tax=Carebara diversa TaxID=615681 RepID=UPI001EE0EE11|nr:NADH dehydrogenase subunit 4 [Carebara diversa]UIO59239.1 NADH dehydrogenase subunit 4 [Carebara diversa]
MMKFMMMVMFMSMMSKKNKMLMFYYNLSFLVSFMLIFKFMFKEEIWNSVAVSLGINYYAIWLVILSFWIVGVMFMSLEAGCTMKIMIFISLVVTMMLFFFSLDFILFYLMFEISLIPTFFLIIYWGGNFERISASYYLLMYMLLVSFPLLIYIFYIYKNSMSFKFSVLKMIMEMWDFSFWEYILLYGAFYIKMPIYIFHVWLPKAHVEAPVYGSMILAGILLKMGSYGLIRLMEIFVKATTKYNYMIFSIGVIGSIFMSLVCLIQVDLKSLVAYSSVVHMNMMLCSLMTLFKVGVLASYIMMVSHGLCSSGLFYMVNIYYERTGSRLLLLNKGAMSKLSSMAFWWFFLCVANFSFPFSLGFFSEIMMLSVILNWEPVFMIYIMMICFISSAYSLNLFSFIQHGNLGGSESGGPMNLVKEFMIIIIHSYPLVLVMLNMLIFM